MSGCCTALYNSSRLECFHYYAQIHCWVFSQSRTVSLLDIVSLTCLKTKQSGKVATPRLFCVLLVWKQSRMVNCSCLFCVFKKKAKTVCNTSKYCCPVHSMGKWESPTWQSAATDMSVVMALLCRYLPWHNLPMVYLYMAIALPFLILLISDVKMKTIPAFLHHYRFV